MTLGTNILFSFLPLLILRPLLYRGYVEKSEELTQPRRAFILDFTLCILAGLIINTYDRIVFDIPILNLFSLFIGCIIAGFFIGLDSALGQERNVILATIPSDSPTGLPKQYYPMTRKFTLVAITASVLVSLVLILVFTRDAEWLATTNLNEETLHQAKMSVIYEVLFIMSVLMLLIVNLIFSYSRNLKLLFKNETAVLERVKRGDLSSKVPVATHDEFGVIANHTNHMIDGLRHRFELISSLKLAEEVQQNLLPIESPNLEHYDISGTSSYCEQTGGDYYDYFLLPGNKVAIVVADACGHGVGAALLMISVRAYITSLMTNYEGGAKLLEQINLHLTKDCSKTSRFTSMFFLELDELQGNNIKWVRAGHEPALYYSKADDNFKKLDGSGLVLGIDHSYKYKEYTADSMQAGDIIFIGTDGIRETQNINSEFFGEDRLKKILQQSVDFTAEQIQKTIVDKVTRFRGNQAQEDDLTLVIIKKS